MNYFNIKRYLSKKRLAARWFLCAFSIIAFQFQDVAGQSNIESCSGDTVLIDFDQDNYVAGRIVSQIQYPGGTLSVFGNNPNFPGQNAAMIFDSGNPTGGDFDLGTPNQAFGGPGMNFDGTPVPSNDKPLHNVLIVSEDLNSSEPDDATDDDIGLIFNFPSPVVSIGMDLLDLDSGEAELFLYDALGNQVYADMVPETGCNGVAHLVLNVPGVTQMIIWLHGSGAIDNLRFIVECEEGGNNNPQPVDDAYNADLDEQLVVEAPGVLTNDVDPDGDNLTISEFDTTTVQGGTVDLNPDGSFAYTPPSGFEGDDSFSYTVTDGNGGEGTATVKVQVGSDSGDDGGDGGDDGNGGDDEGEDPDDSEVTLNSPPIAQDDEYEVNQDSELEVSDPEEGVLANDSDPDGDPITVQEVINEITDQGGSISINPDGTFIYTPRVGFVGTDSIEYTVCDDADPKLCDSATIRIEVQELPIEIFSGFSPNGDGINDTWVIQGITRFPDNVVKIFNRWGNLIFEVSGYDNTAKVWDGTASEGVVLGSNDAPDGAYYYIIELGDGSERLSGYVVIRR